MRNETTQRILREIRASKEELSDAKKYIQRAEERLLFLEEKLSLLFLRREEEVDHTPRILTFDTAEEGQAVEILNKPRGTGKIVKKNRIRAQVQLDSDNTVILRSYPKLRTVPPSI